MIGQGARSRGWDTERLLWASLNVWPTHVADGGPDEIPDATGMDDWRFENRGQE